MLNIRALSYEDMKEAIELKIHCWTEELQGVADNDLEFDSEFFFWTDWMYKAKEHHDIRILLGAYQEERLAGVLFSSIAEVFDGEYAFELNGLWVKEDYRGQGIAKKLIKAAAIQFEKEGFKDMIAYCHHLAPSNAFYKHLGGKVIRREKQMDGLLEVDIFKIPMHQLISGDI